MVFWFFIALTAILLLWLVFGYLPEVEALVAALIGSEVALWRATYKHSKELSSIAKDITYIKEKLK